MNIVKIAEQLQDVGYIVLDAPLHSRMSTSLLARCQDDGLERFHAAQIGRGAARQRADLIRGDVISWLDDEDTIDQSYLAWMDALRIGLNQALYLGLFDYECHYAIYGSGASYGRHLDALSGKRNRIVSTVFYLNEAWQSSDGGQLVLFEPVGDAIIATINPSFGKMIIFLSETFPHEVLAAHTTRRSIAGWFRVRDMA